MDYPSLLLSTFLLNHLLIHGWYDFITFLVWQSPFLATLRSFFYWFSVIMVVSGFFFLVSFCVHVSVTILLLVLTVFTTACWWLIVGGVYMCSFCLFELSLEILILHLGLLDTVWIVDLELLVSFPEPLHLLIGILTLLLHLFNLLLHIVLEDLHLLLQLHKGDGTRMCCLTSFYNFCRLAS